MSKCTGRNSCLNGAKDDDFYNTPTYSILDLVRGYAAFNPHATFKLTINGETIALNRTADDWRKWLPNEPISPHWYTAERLRGLIAAYLTDERSSGHARTVRDFVSEFRGLSGTAKQKKAVEDAGLSGATLADLLEGDDVSLEKSSALLAAMQQESRSVKPRSLGAIGADHLKQHLIDCRKVAPDSIHYKKSEGIEDGVPFILEVAFGIYAEDAQDRKRCIISGTNWTPALSPFGKLRSLLGEMRIDPFDPVVVVVHLASPRIDFTDRGKTEVAL